MKRSFFVAAFFATLLLANGCSRQTATKNGGPVPVLTAQAFTTNVPVRIDPGPVGHVMAYSTVTVHSQIGGAISGIFFQEGQNVKKGDLLYTIDRRPAQATLDQARAALARDSAQLEYSRINFEREKKLFDQKLISQDEFDTNKANYDALTGTVALDRAAVTNALLNLEYCDIRSPMDARTGSLLAFKGNVVKAPDDTLVTLNQIHPIYVQFGVPEQFLPEIKKQMRANKLSVTATFEGMDGPAPQGELTFVDNTVDQTTGMIQLKAAFANEDDALWPGQYVQVQVTLSELTNAVVVPSQAVQVGQNGQFIYVVKSDLTNTAGPFVENRPVKTGIAFGNETVVQSGVAAGETVVTDGQLRLAPKMKVTIKNSDSASKTNAP
jgi:multidrug efflux system membrane fusion protein